MYMGINIYNLLFKNIRKIKHIKLFDKKIRDWTVVENSIVRPRGLQFIFDIITFFPLYQTN